MRMSTRWIWSIATRLMLPLALICVGVRYYQQPSLSSEEHHRRNDHRPAPVVQKDKSTTAAKRPIIVQTSRHPKPIGNQEHVAVEKPVLRANYVVGNNLIKIHFRAADTTKTSSDLLGEHISSAIGKQGQTLRYVKVVNHLYDGASSSEYNLNPTLFESRDREAVFNSNQCSITAITTSPHAFLPDVLSQMHATFSCYHGLHPVQVTWSAVAHPDEHFLRVATVLTPLSHTYEARYLVGMTLKGNTIAATGSVHGSPVTVPKHRLFIGLEHPMSSNGVLNQRRDVAVIGLLGLPRLRPQQASFNYSIVIGAFRYAQDSQRAFWSYLSRVRASNARPFLHYNSWFDFYSWQERNATYRDRAMHQANCLNRVHTIGKELHVKRNVSISSFLWDDGWDNSTGSTLWTFHSGFPQGFTPVSAAAKQYNSNIGVWVSPWGGYGQAKDDRIRYGKANGYETNSDGFSLSGKKYFERFKTITLDFVTKYGVNMFKFDGIAFGDGSINDYMAELEGLLALLRTLRKEAISKLWINLTTGMWPSPFWLLFGDSIWRGHGDLGFHGDGSHRQKWINFRDAVVHKLVVERSRLFPLSALMLHGIITGAVGQSRAAGLNVIHHSKHFEQEVWSYFSMGVQLQELYISPDTMPQQGWDTIAQAANWAHSNAALLQRTRWFGGDPVQLQVYSWSAWYSNDVMLTLRNPQALTQRVTLDLASALQLPDACTHAGKVAQVTLQCRYNEAEACFSSLKGVDCKDDTKCVIGVNTQISVGMAGLELKIWQGVMQGCEYPRYIGE